MTINIKGLTERQRVIADILWLLRGKKEVYTFVDSLPKEMQADAHIVLNMLLAAALDNISDNHLHAAQEVIKKVK